MNSYFMYQNMNIYCPQKARYCGFRTGSNRFTVGHSITRPLNHEPYNLWTSLTLTFPWPEPWVGSGSWTGSKGSDPNPGNFIHSRLGDQSMTLLFAHNPSSSLPSQPLLVSINKPPDWLTNIWMTSGGQESRTLIACSLPLQNWLWGALNNDICTSPSI